MYSTEVFFYYQRQIVVLLSGNSQRSYMPIYAKTLKIHKGVDNQIQFSFRNQAQKAVDITGKDIVCRIISYDGTKVLLKKSLVLQYAATGICALQLSPSEIENINTQKCYYSIEIPVGNYSYPVYVDSNSGGRGEIEIVDSILPSFVPSTDITIPTDQIFPNTNPSLCSVLGGVTFSYYSSTVTSDDCATTTFQATFTNYCGNVVVQGSTLPDSSWYSASETYEYNNYTGTEGYVISGYHPYMRIAFSSYYGNVSNVIVR